MSAIAPLDAKEREYLAKVEQAKKDGYPYACVHCGAGMTASEFCRCQDDDSATYDRMAEIAKTAGMGDLVMRAIGHAKTAPKVVADETAVLLAAAEKYGKGLKAGQSVGVVTHELLDAATAYWEAVK